MLKQYRADCTPYQGKLIYHRKRGNELKQVACAPTHKKQPPSSLLGTIIPFCSDFSIIANYENTEYRITSWTNINITYFCFNVCELFICLSHKVSSQQVRWIERERAMPAINTYYRVYCDNIIFFCVMFVVWNCRYCCWFNPRKFSSFFFAIKTRYNKGF